MSAVRRALVAQFGRPHGVLGALAAAIMTLRPSNRERGTRTLDLLDVRPGERILEIGVGPGLAMQAAVERGPALVVGIDHSPLMVRLARRRNRRAIEAGRAEIREGTPETTLEETRFFDRAFAINVAMFWDDPRTTLRRIGSALVPGGLLGITHQPRHAGARTADARLAGARLVEQLGTSGFEAVRLVMMPMKPVPAVCVLGRAAAPRS